MVSSDTVVGIVGAIILTGAMIAVFYYEADREAPQAPGDIGSGGQLFDYQYVQERWEDEDSGTLAQGGDWDYDLAVEPYAFNVHIVVEWDDHDLQDAGLVGEPSFTIELFDEEGGSLHAQSESPLEHSMNDTDSAPPSMEFTVAADSRQDADGFVEDHMESGAVQSTARNWTVQITLDDDGSVQGIPDPTGGDVIMRSFSVTVHVDHWVPEFSEAADA